MKNLLFVSLLFFNACSTTKLLPKLNQKQALLLAGVQIPNSKQHKLFFKSENDNFSTIIQCKGTCTQIETSLEEKIKPGFYTLVDMMRLEQGKWKHLEFTPFSIDIPTAGVFYTGHWQFSKGEWFWENKDSLLRTMYTDLDSLGYTTVLPTDSIATFD